MQRLAELCAVLGIEVAELLTRALRHSHRPKLRLARDAVLDCAHPALHPLRRWAHHLPATAVLDLPAGALAPLALLCGLSEPDLRHHLAPLTIDPSGSTRA